MTMNRLDEIKKRFKNYNPDVLPIWFQDMEYLIQQAERAEELENRNEQLEYASKYNEELNEFLQKRKLPPNTFGRHVVDVVMDYVEDQAEQINNMAHVIKTKNKEMRGLSNFMKERNIPLKELSPLITVMAHVEQLESIVSNQDKIIDRSSEQNQRYKQALEEIRINASIYMGNSAAQRLYDIATKALKEDEVE